MTHPLLTDGFLDVCGLFWGSLLLSVFFFSNSQWVGAETGRRKQQTTEITPSRRHDGQTQPVDSICMKPAKYQFHMGAFPRAQPISGPVIYLPDSLSDSQWPSLKPFILFFLLFLWIGKTLKVLLEQLCQYLIWTDGRSGYYKSIATQQIVFHQHCNCFPTWGRGRPVKKDRCYLQAQSFFSS